MVRISDSVVVFFLAQLVAIQLYAKTTTGIVIHKYQSYFEDPVNSSIKLVLKFEPLTYTAPIIEIADYDIEKVKPHGKYTTFDEDRLKLEQENTLIPVKEINSEQEDPPWSYHGRFHPGEWHKIDYKRFKIPQVKGWAPNKWGYSSMRFLPDYDAVAVNKSIEDFELIKDFYKWRVKEINEYDSTTWPNITVKQFKRILKLTQLQMKFSDGMTGRLLKRWAHLNKRTLGGILTLREAAFKQGEWNDTDAFDMDALILLIKKYEDNKAIRYHPKLGSTYSRRDFRFIYILALQHAQDHSGQQLIGDAQDINNTNFRQPRFLLQKDGEDWKEHLERFGLDDTDGNYCWWNEQSPMNIITAEAQPSSVTDYEFENHNYFYKFRMYLDYDGTTLLTVKLQDSRKSIATGIKLSGGALTGPNLYLDRIHIKYGQRDNNLISGSEHTINNKGYPMELQFIFTSEGDDDFVPYYFVAARSLRSWKPYREKLVMILVVLVEVDDNISSDEIEIFEGFAQAANQFRKQVEDREPKKYRTWVSVENLFRMSDFIPDSKYYVYRGSLTHPPCIPYVTYSVYETPLKITKKQFDEFLYIPATGFDDTGFVADNVRHIDQIRSYQEDPVNHKHGAVKRARYLRLHRAVFVSDHDTKDNKPEGNSTTDAGNSTDTNSSTSNPFFDYSIEHEGAAIHSITFSLILFSLSISLFMFIVPL